MPTRVRRRGGRVPTRVRRRCERRRPSAAAALACSPKAEFSRSERSVERSASRWSASARCTSSTGTTPPLGVPAREPGVAGATASERPGHHAPCTRARTPREQGRERQRRPLDRARQRDQRCAITMGIPERASTRAQKQTPESKTPANPGKIGAHKQTMRFKSVTEHTYIDRETRKHTRGHTRHSTRILCKRARYTVCRCICERERERERERQSEEREFRGFFCST